MRRTHFDTCFLPTLLTFDATTFFSDANEVRVGTVWKIQYCTYLYCTLRHFAKHDSEASVVSNNLFTEVLFLQHE